MTTDIFLEGIAKIYRDEIWKLYRVPRKILSDREPQFASKFIKELTKALRTKRMLSMVYHPQIDGQIERINQEIETFLQHYVNYKQDDWTKWIAVAEFHYNNKKHMATGQTPFILNFRRHLWKENLEVQIEIPELEEFLIELEKSWKKAMKAIKAAQEMMKKYFDKKQRNPQELKVGDNMWLESKNIHSNRPLKKLD